MQHRLEKINSELQHVLAEVIRELKDPRTNTKLISVTGVSATNDLKQAKVYITVLGNETDLTEALAALKAAEGHIRHEVGAKVDLHSLPELTFIHDTSIENGIKIDSILKEINENA